MKKFAFALLTAMTLGVASSHATLYTLSGTLDPLQAGTNGGFGAFDLGVAGAGNGSGTLTGTYDDVANLISYTITFVNLSAPVTVAHFHRGAPGASGGVDLGIPGPYGSGVVSATGVSVAAAAESNLLAGNWYANIHTSNFTGGEIRGQVGLTVIPEPGISALALGALGIFFLRRRRA